MEFKELKLKYNKLRKEIEIEKLSNIELHNEIQAQINYDLGHKKAWKKVKNEFNGHKKEIPTLKKNGIVADNDQEKADLFIQHYASISNNLPLIDGYHNHYKHVMIQNYMAHNNNETTKIKGIYNDLFTLEQVNNAIECLKPNASPGLDGIHNKLIIQNYKCYNYKLAKIILKMI